MAEALILGIATVLAPLSAALVAGAVQLYKLRKENSEQHGEGRALLRAVHDDVRVLSTKFDDHLRDHVTWAREESR
jgi:hypothetical protein